MLGWNMLVFYLKWHDLPQIQTVTLLETGWRHQSMVTREAGKPVNIVTLEPDRLDVCGPNWKPQTEWGRVWENVRYLVSQLDMRWRTPPRCPSLYLNSTSKLASSYETPHNVHVKLFLLCNSTSKTSEAGFFYSPCVFWFRALIK